MFSHTQYFQMHTTIIDTNLCSGHIIEMCVLAYVCVCVSRWWFFSRYCCLFVVTHLEWQIFPISDANFRHNPKPSVVRTLRTLFFSTSHTHNKIDTFHFQYPLLLLTHHFQKLKFCKWFTYTHSSFFLPFYLSCSSFRRFWKQNEKGKKIFYYI